MMDPDSGISPNPQKLRKKRNWPFGFAEPGGPSDFNFIGPHGNRRNFSDLLSSDRILKDVADQRAIVSEFPGRRNVRESIPD